MRAKLERRWDDRGASEGMGRGTWALGRSSRRLGHMSALDDPKARAAFFAALAAGDGIRAACKMVGVGKSTVHRMRKDDPEFDAEVRATVAGVHLMTKAPPAVVAEVVDLDEHREPATPKPDRPARWWSTLEGIKERFGQEFDDLDTPVPVRVVCARSLFAAALAEANAGHVEQLEPVYVELPPKDAIDGS